MTSNLSPTPKKKGKNTPSDAKFDDRVCANCEYPMMLVGDYDYQSSPGILARCREWECPNCHYFITRYDPPPAPPPAPDDPTFPF